MALLRTLTRVQIAFTLISALVLGSVTTIVARSVEPNKLGLGDVFPDFRRGAYPGVMRAWFWVGLLLELCICVGVFFGFFRNEQLNKP
jgi:alpha-1,3-glucan synthase